MLKEANRCLQCKMPLCQSGCPVSTAIPQVIDLYLKGKIIEAGKLLFENNPLSVVTSLVCPHEKQCRSKCILGKRGEPINIGEIEHMVALNYLRKTHLYAPESNGRKVAIIGSGPAGLTIAFTLAQKGYKITMFEEHDKIGGVLRYGIPDFRLPKTIIDLLEEKLIELGVKIRFNVLIGPVLTLDEIFRDGYQGVFIGTGVWRTNKLGLKGETLGNVHFAIDYLKNPDVFRLGTSLNVIGAGNVAMDVARTAIRKGAIKVNIIYRGAEDTMNANHEEIEMAKDEGVRFKFLRQPVEFTSEGVLCKKMDTKDDDIELIPCDSIIIAVGQGPRANIVATSKDLELSSRGLIMTDNLGRTSKPGVFASGDVVTGAKTVVEAVNVARKVGQAIEEFINEGAEKNDSI